MDDFATGAGSGYGEDVPLEVEGDSDPEDVMGYATDEVLRLTDLNTGQSCQEERGKLERGEVDPILWTAGQRG